MIVNTTSPIAYALQNSIEALRHNSKDSVHEARKNKPDFYQEESRGTTETQSPVYDSEGKTVTQAPANLDVDL